MSTAPETRGERSTAPGGSFGIGLLLIGAGALWLLANLGLVEVSFTLIGSILLIALGVTLVVLARAGPHRGLVLVGVVGTIVLAIFTGVGSPGRTIHPPTASALHRSYNLGFGSLTIDLSNVSLAPGSTRLSAHVGTGRVAVIVPAGVGIETRAQTGTGRVAVWGTREKGPV